MTVLQFQWRQFLCVLPDTKITHENARKFRCKLHRLCRWEGELRGLGGRPLQDGLSEAPRILHLWSLCLLARCTGD